ncbi:putative tight adherance operon protein [Yersinia enterocolitica]|uniref:tetratricopeptide repeat protein n=1 Tax=Yersinia enterocolitica TaxID=630 RepID=UPI000281992C|nr:tetratricopeptide repeat protein [Yersinia enterocolitica]AJI82666.1 tetratricopeptide repeat family protein [Yersinia enterocolitica]EKA26371.1 flp pilus assembly protein TadD, contains TPR repeat [Yersinia enterocolitica subsp. enterocolitica WA-314]ELI8281602.1 tetratricopeptide repeat protein [Yersinia enterocolitica]KGA69392.1 tetratricopeptide repeat family protein [Yersinia enterocolitica]KGA77768.1 tetratricopeptide repeat family protein [Yersinia enterocolitica]
MNKKISITITALLFTVVLNGCSTHNSISSKEFYYRESILLKANNYPGLITLYRDKLKLKEDDSVRLKLANAYYLTGDIKSSLYYLRPISHKENASIYTLQIKNLISNNDNAAAKIVVNKLLAISPDSAEAHNLNGIILANDGEINKAEAAIEKSRSLFISDEIAMNNLAVTAMLDDRYSDAVRILLPDYLAGKRGSLMLHNLVFSLVQLGDTQYAKKIIVAEKMAENPDQLILALSQVTNLRQGRLPER